MLSAEHFQLGAQVAVGSDSAAHEERCGAIVLCFESLRGAFEHVHELVHCGVLKAGGQVGHALLGERQWWAGRGSIGNGGNTAHGVEQGGLHAAETEIKRAFVGLTALADTARRQSRGGKPHSRCIT